jgi:hypothetical protein
MSAPALRVGIIQSSYLPWRGYFDLIDDVELFIFLEDVQYSHGTWRNRNRIKTPQGRLWLSVPVHHHSHSLIQEVEIDYRHRWVDKHVASLRQHYGRAPHFHTYCEPIFEILAGGERSLSVLNIALTRRIMGMLGISTETRLSSEFAAAGAKDDRVLAILRACGATRYLSGPAAKSYLEPRRFTEANVSLAYKTYDYAEYPQLYGAFEGQVTVLDLLFNCGPESRRHLKSRTPNERAVSVTEAAP